MHKAKKDHITGPKIFAIPKLLPGIKFEKFIFNALNINTMDFNQLFF